MPGVCLSVCSVCLSLCVLAKTNEPIFVKILPLLYVWTRQNRLNFGSHTPPDRIQEFFQGLFNIARLAFTVWLLFPEKKFCDFHKFFTIYSRPTCICFPVDVSLHKDVPVKLQRWSEFLVRIRFALAGVYVLSQCCCGLILYMNLQTTIQQTRIKLSYIHYRNED